MTDDFAKDRDKAAQLVKEVEALRKEGHSDLALPKARQAYELREVILGPDDLYTLSALHLIIYCLDDLGKLGDADSFRSAYSLCQILVDRRSRSVGVDSEEYKDAIAWLKYLQSRVEALDE